MISYQTDNQRFTYRYTNRVDKTLLGMAVILFPDRSLTKRQLTFSKKNLKHKRAVFLFSQQQQKYEKKKKRFTPLQWQPNFFSQVLAKFLPTNCNNFFHKQKCD